MFFFSEIELLNRALAPEGQDFQTYSSSYEEYDLLQASSSTQARLFVETAFLSGEEQSDGLERVDPAQL